MVKRLETSPHDPLGITDSACKNQSVMVSIQYGPFNPYIPIRSTTIGPNQTLEEFRPAVTTSPKTRRSGGRPATAPPPRQKSRRQRITHDAKRDATARPATIERRKIIDQQRPASLDQWRQPSDRCGQRAQSSSRDQARPARLLITRHARPPVEIQVRHGATSHDRRRHPIGHLVRQASNSRRPSCGRCAASARPACASACGGERGPPHTAAAGWPTSNFDFNSEK
ncbi:WD repeat-containing protein 44-like [Dorcoceras hygrometricum]|uniref:WD repeat-containing protein 44-like n=1 Tax=Dorcoceras hygrometricum TaxID=472368 RepID=A0A2Z7ABZ2_9LAMI|nr:WD repeat-containing protein 44-like [Dorcoceras hygrometricum]